MAVSMRLGGLLLVSAAAIFAGVTGLHAQGGTSAAYDGPRMTSIPQPSVQTNQRVIVTPGNSATRPATPSYSAPSWAPAAGAALGILNSILQRQRSNAASSQQAKIQDNWNEANRANETGNNFFARGDYESARDSYRQAFQYIMAMKLALREAGLSTESADENGARIEENVVKADQALARQKALEEENRVRAQQAAEQARRLEQSRLAALQRAADAKDVDDRYRASVDDHTFDNDRSLSQFDCDQDPFGKGCTYDGFKGTLAPAAAASLKRFPQSAIAGMQSKLASAGLPQCPTWEEAQQYEKRFCSEKQISHFEGCDAANVRAVTDADAQCHVTNLRRGLTQQVAIMRGQRDVSIQTRDCAKDNSCAMPAPACADLRSKIMFLDNQIDDASNPDTDRQAFLKVRNMYSELHGSSCAK